MKYIFWQHNLSNPFLKMSTLQHFMAIIITIALFFKQLMVAWIKKNLIAKLGETAYETHNSSGLNNKGIGLDCLFVER